MAPEVSRPKVALGLSRSRSWDDVRATSSSGLSVSCISDLPSLFVCSLVVLRYAVPRPPLLIRGSPPSHGFTCGSCDLDRNVSHINGAWVEMKMAVRNGICSFFSSTFFFIYICALFVINMPICVCKHLFATEMTYLHLKGVFVAYYLTKRLLNTYLIILSFNTIILPLWPYYHGL